MKKVSFDFDSCLDRLDVQEVATRLVKSGYDVYIVTSRCCTATALERGHYWVERWNQDLYKVSLKCKIKKENIIFTEHIDKIVYLKDKGFLFHLDDDEYEIDEIVNSGDSCVGINVDRIDWENKINICVNSSDMSD